MIKNILLRIRDIFLVILAIGVVYFINVGSPDTNRAGQPIYEGD
jgi:hypothetical protein